MAGGDTGRTLWAGGCGADAGLALRLHLDVGCVDLRQEDLLRLQAAQFAQLLLQPHVLLIHVQPQAVADRRGTLQFDHYRSTEDTTGSAFASQTWTFGCGCSSSPVISRCM